MKEAVTARPIRMPPLCELKDDHMRNGQLKPTYNVQASTENPMIVHYTLHQKTNDIHTLKPHPDSFEYLYENLPETLTADAGNGNEENYEYLEEKGVESYVKYNTFDKEQGVTKRKKDKREEQSPCSAKP